jgi:uncharacterized protein (DUF1499 family)
MQTFGTMAKPTARWPSVVLIVAFALAVVSVGAMLLSGPGYQSGLWHFRTGFMIIRWAFWGALAAAVLAAIGFVLPGDRARLAAVLGGLGLIIGLLGAYVPWSWKRTLDSVPYIHDITTDLDNPPAFVAVKSLRKEGDHPVTYDGPEVAAQQRTAYPELGPLVLSEAPGKVFEASKRVVSKMGMELVDANPQELRVEATDTSRFYGFKDDIVVRITPKGEGSQVDVRSKSRVGRSDLGQNAKRIRTFLAELRTTVQGG